MASADTIAASHHYLPCPPLAETIINGLGGLLFASALAGWHQGGHGTMAAAMVEKCVWRFILLVFCAQFYAGVIVVVAENRLISIINDNIVDFL